MALPQIGLEAILKDAAFNAAMSGYIKNVADMGKHTDLATGNIGQKFLNLGSTVTKFATITAGAMIGVGAAVVGMATKAAIDALPLQGIADAFAGITGNADVALAALREGSLGMVKDAELMKSYNSAAQLVSKTFADQLPNAMGYLSKVSAATGQDMGFMIDSLVKGVGRMSPMILDNLGIQVNLTEANEAYADQIGKTAAELTKAEQQTALMAMTMKKLEENTAAMPGVAGTAMQQWAAFGVSLVNVKDRVGMAVIPAFQSMMGVAGKLADKFLPIFEEKLVPLLEQKVIPAVEKMAEALLKLIEGDVSGALSGLVGPETATQILEVAAAVQAFIDKVIAFVTEHAEPLKAALIAIAAVLAAAAIASAIVGIAGAIAALANPITLIILAVGLLAAAWTADWGGIRTTLTAFWIETAKPFIDQMVTWFTTTLPAALVDVRDWFIKTWASVQAAVQTAWKALVKVWEALTKTFTVEIPGAARNLWEQLADTLASIRRTFEDVWNNILGFLRQLWDTIRIVVLTAIILVLNLLGTNLDEIKAGWDFIWNAIRDHVTAIWNTIKATVETVFNAVSAFIGTTLATLKTGWETSWNAVSTVASTIWDAIYTKVSAMVESIRAYVDEKVTALKTQWETAWGLIRDTVGAIWDAIKTKVEEILPAIIAVVVGKAAELKASFIDPIIAAKDAVVDMVGSWVQVGKDLLDGLIKGFKDRVGRLIQSVRDAINNAVAEAKSRLGIGSPSKVAALQIGAPFGEGITLGIENAMRQLARIDLPRMMAQITAPAITRPAMARVHAATSMPIVRGGNSTTISNSYQYDLTAQYRYQEQRSLMDDVRMLRMLGGA